MSGDKFSNSDSSFFIMFYVVTIINTIICYFWTTLAVFTTKTCFNDNSTMFVPTVTKHYMWKDLKKKLFI